jgi:hypothetical protein
MKGLGQRGDFCGLLWLPPLLFVLLLLCARHAPHLRQLVVFLSFKSSTDGAYILVRGQ